MYFSAYQILMYIYIYYTVYTLIELAFQKRKFRHQLYQVVCCFCRVRSCGEYAGSLLGVWRSRGFQSEVVVLEILSWVAIIGNLLLSSLTSLISYWCPRYGCACVLLFPLCHLADRHRFAARCCKAWLSHSLVRGHSLSQLISWLTCRTVSGWNTTVFSHVTSFHMAGQEVNSPNMSLTQFGERLHPGRLTWTIIMEVWKIIFLSKWVICRFHVNLPGCMIYSWSISLSWFYVVTSEVCVDRNRWEQRLVTRRANVPVIGDIASGVSSAPIWFPVGWPLPIGGWGWWLEHPIRGVITNRGYLQNIEKPIEKPPIWPTTHLSVSNLQESQTFHFPKRIMFQWRNILSWEVTTWNKLFLLNDVDISWHHVKQILFKYQGSLGVEQATLFTWTSPFSLSAVVGLGVQVVDIAWKVLRLATMKGSHPHSVPVSDYRWQCEGATLDGYWQVLFRCFVYYL